MTFYLFLQQLPSTSRKLDLYSYIFVVFYGSRYHYPYASFSFNQVGLTLSEGNEESAERIPFEWIQLQTLYDSSRLDSRWIDEEAKNQTGRILPILKPVHVMLRKGSVEKTFLPYYYKCSTDMSLNYLP